MMLKIAQDVKDWKRPDHANAMIKKREELYDYIKGRVVAMLSTLKSAETRTSGGSVRYWYWSQSNKLLGDLLHPSQGTSKIEGE